MQNSNFNIDYFQHFNFIADAVNLISNRRIRWLPQTLGYSVVLTNVDERQQRHSPWIFDTLLPRGFYQIHHQVNTILYHRTQQFLKRKNDDKI